MAAKRVNMPPCVASVAALEDLLSTPSAALIDDAARLEGDLVILGVGGKMGPTLARLAVRAVAASGVRRTVYGVSSFSEKGLRKRMESWGVKTVRADLLERDAWAALPDAANVIFMAGRKFGSSGAEWATWATNAYMPALAAHRYADARIVAFSTGSIYPLEPVLQGGSTERTPVAPAGEYAMSCVGRERLLEHFSRRNGTPVLLYRLNYAAELRYGVLADIATKVWSGAPIDVAMGHFNCVWQGYANAVALRALRLASCPPRVLNVTGPEQVSVRWAAARFGDLMGKMPRLTGEESPTALLSNAAECHRLFGYPDVALDTLMEWVALWVMKSGKMLGKPTHFEVRDGRY